MANASETVDSQASATALSKSNNLKATKFPNLFYSPDYKELFNKEIEEITLELLETAELVLTNFDYKTIEGIGDYRPSVSYDEFDSITSVELSESDNITVPQTTLEQSDITYNIAATTISPIKYSIQSLPGISYSSILSNYGYHSSGPNNIKNYAGYRSNGQAYYDLEIPVLDVDGVIGYNIYMIEEVE